MIRRIFSLEFLPTGRVGQDQVFFPKALGKLNEFRPEFVIMVGDLNLGGVGNRKAQGTMAKFYFTM